MAGAALMTSLSALRSGAGIVHLLHPEEYSLEFVGQPLEVVRIAYSQNDFDYIKSWLDKASGAFLGPGLGTGPKQEALFNAIWPDCKGKMVLDADLLTWLAKTKAKSFGPLQNAILTPHLGELSRFFEQKEPLSLELIKKTKRLVDDSQTNLILKGGPSFLFSHGKTPIVMTQGDPGMATAGSGDVLTGILASLLSQGKSARDAMLLGSWLHGTAGELAAQQETSYCMTATSIIASLPSAFRLTLSQNLPILA
jgi:NAD(P)H-hydrate epimerase